MCDCLIGAFMPWVDKGRIPDWVIRKVTRSLLSGRLKSEAKGGDIVAQQEAMRQFIAGLRDMPIAINTSDANEQHYEVGTLTLRRLVPDPGVRSRPSTSILFWDRGKNIHVVSTRIRRQRWRVSSVVS